MEKVEKIFSSKMAARVYEIKDNKVHLELSQPITFTSTGARDKSDSGFLMTLDLDFFKDIPSIGDEFKYFMSIEREIKDT
jgi:hypothetical protein